MPPFLSYAAGTWKPSSASEHAADILAQINAVLAANNVLDGSGNVIQFAASLGNVVWIMCLSLGQILADNDQDLLGASQMFSVAEETDAQLASTLPMTGTSFIPGAYSLVTLVVTADSSGATVPSGTKAAYGTICNFVAQATLTLGSGSSGSLLCEADVLGPIAVPPGTLTSFTTTVPHVASITNPAAAVVGRNVETSQQIRQRLLQGNTANQNLQGTARAIASIQGITQSAVYLNQSPTVNLVLQGPINVPPLSAYIVVAGSDITGDAIATAYAERMLIQTFSVGPGAPANFSRSDFTFAASGNTITSAGGSFSTAGFVAGQWWSVTGSGSNNFTFKVGSVSGSSIVVAPSSATVTNEAAGATVTFTAKNVQPYMTAAGQLIAVQYDNAVAQNVYVTVYYEAGTPTQVGFDTTLQAIVAGIPWTIGAHVTGAAIASAIAAAGYTYAVVTGVAVSLDNTSWHNEVIVNGNALPSIPSANVTVAAG